VGVVQEAIEHGGDGGVVAEQPAPVVDRPEVSRVLARS
jgi:hypothetical protein